MNLRGVMKELLAAGMHLNDSKIQLKKKKVLFLGYDVLAAKFCLDSYIQEQNLLLC